MHMVIECTHHGMAAETDVWLLLISKLMCLQLKVYYSFCLALRLLKFNTVLRKNPLSAQRTPVYQWAMQSQSLTLCKLVYIL